MVKQPSAATLETALPLIIPKKQRAPTAPLAGPPLYLPTKELARSKKNSPPPVDMRTPENTRKPTRNSPMTFVGNPRRPSDVNTKVLSVVSSGKLTPHKNPGIKSA